MASTIGATSKVYKNVRSYFERELKNYEVILVRQKITEDYLYRVIAQNKITGKYAEWKHAVVELWSLRPYKRNSGWYFVLQKESGIFD